MQAWTSLCLFIWIRTLLAVFVGGYVLVAVVVAVNLPSLHWPAECVWGVCSASTMMIFYSASDHLLWFGSALVAAGWCCADCHLGHDDDDDDFLLNIRVWDVDGVTPISGSTDFHNSALHPSSHDPLPMLLPNPVTSSDLCTSFTYYYLFFFPLAEERTGFLGRWFICSELNSSVDDLTRPQGCHSLHGRRIWGSIYCCLNALNLITHSCALHGWGLKVRRMAPAMGRH